MYGLVLSVLCFTGISSASSIGDRDNEQFQPNIQAFNARIEELFVRIEGLQEKRDVPYKPPISWAKTKGMWESDIKFYFHGHEELFLMREGFSIYDDNMFATAWITSCLLETFRYGNGPKPSEEMITSAVMAIKEYNNKNLNYSNSLMTFWPQVYNETYKVWNSYPGNLHHFFTLAASTNFTTFEKILEDIGLGDVAKIMKTLLEAETGYLHAFMIPPDFDDTFVNLGLGSLLTTLKEELPQSHAQWRSQNTNLTSVFHALKKYAYHPLSQNKAINTIDCRTYFYLRYFLEDALQRGEDIMLISTWAQDLDELLVMAPKGVAMPLNTNNVDVTVAANGVFGMTAAILNGLVEPKILDDPKIQQIYVNTSSLIAFMIQTNFSSRPDLALLYYPSAMEFFWFVARTYGELQRKSNEGPLPHPVLERVRTKLDVVLHNHMTQTVLNQSLSDADGFIYFDDFLGDGDLTSNNNTIIRGQDRLFTTGMAINALLSTWTVFQESSKTLVWQKDTPAQVKDTVARAASFINKHVFGLTYQPWNAFFSGSIKSESTWAIFPLTREYVNNTPSQEFRMFGVEGIIPENEYEMKLKQKNKYTGQYPPIDFHGYNKYPDYWPFWSSEPYTYVTNMLALAKYSNTVDLDQLTDDIANGSDIY